MVRRHLSWILLAAIARTPAGGDSGGGFISDKYGVLQEGVQVEQSVTPR
jgi:hypothetical protein